MRIQWGYPTAKAREYNRLVIFGLWPQSGRSELASSVSHENDWLP